MEPADRKKASVVVKYASENFGAGDWYTLGQITGHLQLIENHPRLLRSMSFGDPDYEGCAAQIVDQIFEADPSTIDDVVDHFDIDLWYQSKHPEKFDRVFNGEKVLSPSFWKTGYLRAFISHISENRKKVGGLKASLETWGITAFVAHQDIEPSKEWQVEITAGLKTMDVMLAVLDNGFRESAWTDQEVGFAVCRNVEIVPLIVDFDPHGFVGKIQGIKAKGKLPNQLASEVAQILLRKPRHRKKLVEGLCRALPLLPSAERLTRIRQLGELLTDEQAKDLLERTIVDPQEKQTLSDLATRVGAFKPPPPTSDFGDEVPF